MGKITVTVMETKVPADLKKVVSSGAAKAKWETLTPLARRDFISWIESAKQPETRKRRVDSVPSRLASGKRRPCCYAIVPMNVYKVIGENKKAKAVWSGFTPDEKRDFVDKVKGKDKNDIIKNLIK